MAIPAAGVALDEFGTSSPTTWLLATPVLLLLGYLTSLGPKWALAFLIGAIVFGFSETVALGSFDLRVPDLFYVILFGWALVIRARGGQRGHLMGRPLLALWFVTLGLLSYPLLLQGEIGTDELIPWLRLVATFSLVWLVPVRTPDPARRPLRARGPRRSGDRRDGEGGRRRAAPRAGVDPARGNVGDERDRPHSVWVVILAIHGPVPRQRSLRIVMLVVGTTGLLMTRSLGATAALVVALGLYGLTNAGRWRSDAKPALVTPYRLLLVVVAGLAVADDPAAGEPSRLREFRSSSRRTGS